MVAKIVRYLSKFCSNLRVKSTLFPMKRRAPKAVPCQSLVLVSSLFLDDTHSLSSFLACHRTNSTNHSSPSKGECHHLRWGVRTTTLREESTIALLGPRRAQPWVPAVGVWRQPIGLERVVTAIKLHEIHHLDHKLQLSSPSCGCGK